MEETSGRATEEKSLYQDRHEHEQQNKSITEYKNVMARISDTSNLYKIHTLIRHNIMTTDW